VTVTDHPATDPYERHVAEWTRNELSEGRGAQPAQAVELILRLAVGDGDSLSGLHLSVHDDLDSLLARRHEVRARELYVLRPSRLDDETPRSVRCSGTSTYYMGRPAATWKAALQRRAS
jgi:hypothetical protein